MCGIDRVVFGTDFGPVPYGVREHVDMVTEIVPKQEDWDKVYWRNNDAIFGLGLEALAHSSA